MRAVKIVIIGFVVIVAAFVSFLGYMGMFSKITVTEKEMGSYTYAFESFTGPYSDTGAVFDKVNAELSAAGIINETGIGVYYDNPATVDPSKLRSDCGSIIAEADAVKVKKLKDLSVGTLAKTMFMVAEFPVKNSLSYMMGPMKVYSSIAAYMKDKNYKPAPGIEIYEMKNNRILYLMPVIK